MEWWKRYSLSSETLKFGGIVGLYYEHNLGAAKPRKGVRRTPRTAVKSHKSCGMLYWSETGGTGDIKVGGTPARVGCQTGTKCPSMFLVFADNFTED